ncbi:co-chaperone GroES family protein [bacterium]|nr:co-chaperone GroES family protein [bacterium]|tara:strand:- start:1 stop:321 length:321 start_codon:yes stop_codon:yes gene_type:complete
MSSSKALTKVVAVFDAIIVRPLEEEETTFGSIIVPDMGKEKHITGDVISVGPGRMSVMGNLIPTVIKVGDRVILPQVGVTKIDSIEGELVACDEGKVLAILKSNDE